MFLRTSIKLLIGSIVCFGAIPSQSLVYAEDVTGFAQLKLQRALPVDGVRDPSGLTIHNQVLYAISDKVDNVIWRVDIGPHKAELREHLRFECTEFSGEYLDLEGISVDTAGNFYLLSEKQFAVIRVTPHGQASVVSTFENAGRRNGLFATQGAGPEAILWQPKRYLVSSEREPSGILAINANRQTETTVFHDSGQIPVATGRPADLTGIDFFQNQIWCLTRNAESIFRVELHNNQEWSRKDAFSFSHVVRKPKFAYRDMRYGHAEGMAINAQSVFVVLDNNNDPRRANPNDRRPLLLIFQNPMRQESLRDASEVN